jgi:hypothetical protein
MAGDSRRQNAAVFHKAPTAASTSRCCRSRVGVRCRHMCERQAFRRWRKCLLTVGGWPIRRTNRSAPKSTCKVSRTPAFVIRSLQTAGRSLAGEVMDARSSTADRSSRVSVPRWRSVSNQMDHHFDSASPSGFSRCPSDPAPTSRTFINTTSALTANAFSCRGLPVILR